jgi:RNA polymerase-binding transcription factor DksA
VATKKVATTSKKAAAKTASKSAASKKAPASKKAAASKAAPAKGKADDGKGNRKGITIVTKKKIVRRPQPPKGRPSLPKPTGSIMGMGLGGGRPLIPSSNKPAGLDGEADADGKKVKSPFNKRQLDKFREVLLGKRRELLGDIDSMENEALKSEGGASSSLPQHLADQGSDAYDQTLSLDLAAADRTLLKEIDAALDRIAAKTFGVCEHTGKPISKDRLDELPWARFSIEAAREMERRGR